MSRPVTRVIALLTSAKSCRLVGSAQASPLPVAFGVHLSVWMPLPQNQMPNEVGKASPAANAVPLLLHMASSIGSHMATPTPPSAPRRANRREIFRSFSRLIVIDSPL